jgi:hypothetical protein
VHDNVDARRGPEKGKGKMGKKDAEELNSNKRGCIYNNCYSPFKLVIIITLDYLAHGLTYVIHRIADPTKKLQATVLVN